MFAARSATVSQSLLLLGFNPDIALRGEMQRQVHRTCIARYLHPPTARKDINLAVLMYARSSNDCFRVSLLSSVLDHKQASRQVYDGFCFGREGLFNGVSTPGRDHWLLRTLRDMRGRLASTTWHISTTPPRTNVEVRYELPTAVQTTGHCALELT
jgi:hypothetical protein